MKYQAFKQAGESKIVITSEEQLLVITTDQTVQENYDTVEKLNKIFEEHQALLGEIKEARMNDLMSTGVPRSLRDSFRERGLGGMHLLGGGGDAWRWYNLDSKTPEELKALIDEIEPHL